VQYWWDVLDTVLIYTIFAVSLNLLVGTAGQLSVAHAALGGIGGYAAAYLAIHAHFGLVPGLVAGTTLAGFVGAVVALPALRLSAEYLILLTVAISSIFTATVQAVPSLGGNYGLVSSTAATLPFGSHALVVPGDWVAPLALVAAAALTGCTAIGRSAFGRVLRGIREDELATRSLGKNVVRFKIVVFGVTAALAGLAGALLFFYNQLVSPDIYGFDVSLTIFAMVIFAGMGNLPASVLGAALLVLTRPLLEKGVQLSPDRASIWRLMIYGLGLVVFVRLLPRGIVPEGARVLPVRREPATAAIPAPAPYSLGGGRGPVLALHDVSKRFGGIAAVDGLSFQLRRGEVTALIGPNGAGKTTVFNLLTGAIRPDAGQVLLHGRDVTGARPEEMARMGVVRSFQDVRAFGRMSALDNVALGVQGQTGERLLGLVGRPRAAVRDERGARAEALAWLDFVGLADRPARRVADMSFAEQKLVALARVLAAKPEVLLLDEPASGIEPAWVQRMLDLIAGVRDQGRTICIVEHSIEVVDRIADTVCFMELGRVTARGALRELLADARLSEAYFGVA
jgi:branched-chain amino acid transport system permease protein